MLSPYYEDRREELNERREQIEDVIIALPGDRDFEEYPGWVEVNDALDAIAELATTRTHNLTQQHVDELNERIFSLSF